MAFTVTPKVDGSTTTISLSGELDASSAPQLQQTIDQSTSGDTKTVVLDCKDLEYIASAGLRVLVWAKQRKLGSGVDLYVIAPQEQVLDTLNKTGVNNSVIIADTYAG
jgi:anti-anti-sigma factor